MKLRRRFILWCGVILFTGFQTIQAATFTSTDDAFTLDMPSGWSEVSPLPTKSVMTLQKGNSRVDIKSISCTTETCIEQKINSDLVEVKRKNMQVIGNSYTGEEIKRIEFSTGEPFFYISFFSSKNDFGAGYFLINSKAYSILARDLSYAETDLIFSFISPKQSPGAATISEGPVELEVNMQDPRAYDIAAVPSVEEETLQAPQENIATAKVSAPTAVAKPSRLKAKLRFIKKRFTHIKLQLLAPDMPPYIRHLGHGFDVLVGLIILFALIQLVTGLIQLIKPARFDFSNANPNSLYPIQFVRLYGTPSLIFRAKDNQGNVLISLSSRWDSLLLLLGILTVVSTLIALAITGFIQNNHLLPLSAFAYNTLYAAYSLFIPIGFVFVACGIIWSQLVLREIALFNHKGNKVAIVLQKGFGLFQERYEIYFARSKEVVLATRKRFSWRRNWHMYTREGQLLAELTEISAFKAALRKLFGHCWGILRTDYTISGQMDCSGTLQNAHTALDRFTCLLDKPQALNARDLLVVSLLINIRDRDKWYPWFN